MKKKSKVSIIVPTRNEDKYISSVLDSLISQDYPKENMELLIVDGMSVDKTREIVGEYQKNFKFIKLLDNPNLYTPYAFNVGIKHSEGDVIIFMGAHTDYSANYISTVEKYLSESKADCVGSIAHTLSGKSTFIAKAIALGLGSPFGVGNSYMRIGSKRERYVDTASCPGYKKEVFKKIGLFNEKLAHSQDIEFNLRLKKSGGRILAVPSIVSYYHARSDFVSFCKHNFRNGAWAIIPFKYTNVIPVKWRHLVPLTFILSLIATLGLWSLSGSWGMFGFIFIGGAYSLCNIFYSFKITLKEKDFRYLLIMPAIFASLHLVYGMGSLWGSIKILVVLPHIWKRLLSQRKRLGTTTG